MTEEQATASPAEEETGLILNDGPGPLDLIRPIIGRTGKLR